MAERAAVQSEPTLIAAFVLLWLSAACGGDCTEASVCDIRSRSCQQQTMESVACLRGREVIALPEVRVISESELRRVFDEDGASSDEDMRSEEERAAQVSRWSRGLSLLGLSPADYSQSDADNDSVNEIAAVYLQSNKQILIVDRGTPNDDQRAVAVLAHETVHAMQDAELDLEAYLQQWTASYDERLAVRAITEGEAVLYDAQADHIVTAWKIRAANDEQRAPWLAGPGWRAGDHQTAYSLVEEPGDSEPFRVELIDDAKLEWNAPPESAADEMSADASPAISPYRHAYAATRPLPGDAPPSAQ